MNTERIARKRQLTAKQSAVLEFVTATTPPPTNAQTSAHFGWQTPVAAYRHIQALIRKGALPRDWPGTAKAPARPRTAFTVGRIGHLRGYDLDDCDTFGTLALAVGDFIDRTRDWSVNMQSTPPLVLLRVQLDADDGVIDSEPVSSGELMAILLKMGRVK